MYKLGATLVSLSRSHNLNFLRFTFLCRMSVNTFRFRGFFIDVGVTIGLLVMRLGRLSAFFWVARSSFFDVFKE